MIYLIGTARSGSSSFIKYLQEFYSDKIVKKILIHRVPDEYNSMYEFGKELLSKYPDSILLDRKNKRAQSESLCFRKLKYGDDFKHYFSREVYDQLDEGYIKEATLEFVNQSQTLKKLSEEFNKQILYYEDLFYSTLYLKERGLYNEDLYDKYLHPRHKQRLFKQNNNLL